MALGPSCCNSEFKAEDQPCGLSLAESGLHEQLHDPAFGCLLALVREGDHRLFRPVKCLLIAKAQALGAFKLQDDCLDVTN